MTDRKKKAIDYLNKPFRKSDMWVAIKLTIGGIIFIVLSLIFTPVIGRYYTSWHPYTQLAVTVTFLLTIFFYIRRKTT